jgi:aspartate 1-decarboxylase
MEIQVLKSKLHCVTITQAELDYSGSIIVDENLMAPAHPTENEQVHVLTKNNGERFITDVIKGDWGSGVICLNDPAALRIKLGDVVIVPSYATMNFETAETFRPWVIFPDTATNALK